MPVMSWLDPLLNYGLPALTNTLGSRRQARADAEAARIQAEFLEKALEVEKEKEQYSRSQYANYLDRLRPYGDVGTAAVDRASNLITRSRYQPGTWTPSAAQGVRMRAPDGSERVVPHERVAEALRLGAVRAE